MKKFLVDPENISSSLSQALEYIQSSLKAYSLNPKQESRAVLMAEESLTLLMKYADFSHYGAFYVNVSKLFGSIRIKLIVPGKHFNFGEALAADSGFDDDGMPETQDAVQNILIRSFEDKLKYEHRHACNRITVTAVKSPLAKIYKTFAALFAAVILGILLKNFAPESFCTALNDIFLFRFRTMYMNALKVCVTPLVFLSIIVCISQFESLSEMGRIGARIMVSFLTKTFLSASIGAGVFFIFRPGAGLHIAAQGAAAIASRVSELEGDFITDIIPSNIFRPFLEMNMLQIIFMAIFLGAAMSMIGDAAKILRDFFEALNKLFMSAVKILISMIPVMAFCSILSMLLSADTGILASLVWFCAAVTAGFLLVMCQACVYVAVFGRLNPITYIKKYSPVMLFASLSSTLGCIPINMEYCGKMGIPKHIYSFSVPLGATVSLDGAAMYIVLSSLMLAQIYGIKLNADDVWSVIISAAILAVSAPGIPGAMLICIAVLISYLGIPAEALGIVMSVDAILGILRTPVNVFSAASTALVVSSRMGVLDKDMFYAKEAA